MTDSKQCTRCGAKPEKIIAVGDEDLCGTCSPITHVDIDPSTGIVTIEELE